MYLYATRVSIVEPLGRCRGARPCIPTARLIDFIFCCTFCLVVDFENREDLGFWGLGGFDL